MENDVIDFLQESNYIENVRDSQSLDQAVEAWKFISKQTELNIDNILDTQEILMRFQDIPPEDKGNFRTVAVFIAGREGKPWYAVDALIRAWLDKVNDLVKGVNVSFIRREELIEEHHIEFEKIHPFYDGNGRMGRILLNWERVRVGLPILVIREEDKEDYYMWFR